MLFRRFLDVPNFENLILKVERQAPFRIEHGTINCDGSRDYPVEFAQPFSEPPTVVFAAISRAGVRENIAAMINTYKPTTNGFSVRVIKTNNDFATGVVHWIAIGEH
jgi:hypothetical protein